MRRSGRAVAVAVAVAYAWWATNVRPFTTWAYALVALPSLIVVVLHIQRRVSSPARDTARSERGQSAAPPKSARPWLVLFGGALALEVVGLLLGGRSKSVPTLSTTVDHALIWHWSRSVLFLWWLSVGFALRWWPKSREGSL